MADSLLITLEKLDARIKDLLAQRDELASRNATLEEENEELRRQRDEAIATRDRAKLDIEYLTMSYRLAADPDSLIETRRHIAKLIRNIDRCLDMLKE